MCVLNDNHLSPSNLIKVVKLNFPFSAFSPFTLSGRSVKRRGGGWGGVGAEGGVGAVGKGEGSVEIFLLYYRASL